MIRAGITNRLKQLALGGAVAALVAVGAGGAQVAGDPSQWGSVALGPAIAGHQALNFTKIEYKNTALNFTKIEDQARNSAKSNVQDLHVTMSEHQAPSYAMVEM